ncbi:hypothetical protein A3196_12480 [Candidatus Thiodiazotropha endoloripes]|uniref:Uncharacterized protein n=1 Tax=Candidatus Thiodiazotropha endoloripes TaxID=1818881 RepID=A0A1E2URT9_9GAMM|nr:hypothetical protein A3196_12480 [Candidatus Thiodiazotropha endoloripes]
MARMYIDVPILGQPMARGCLAVALYIGCVSVIMVNLIFAAENRLAYKTEFKTDNSLNDLDGA